MKVSHFGQVVFPASRAVDVTEEFDEEIPNPYETNLVKVSPVGQVATVIFAIGVHPLNFVNVYVLPSDAKPNVTFEIYRNKQLTDESKPKPCFTLNGFYLPNSKSLVFTSRNFIDPQICFELNKKIFDLIETTSELQVFVMDVKSDTYYYGAHNPEEGAYLRKIETSKIQILENEVKAMKIPNTLDGFSAAIMSHCEIHNIYAASFVVVTRAVNFDVESTNLFRVLKKIPRLASLVKESNETTIAAMKSLSKNNFSLYA